MGKALTLQVLRRQTLAFRGTGGTSLENCEYGFQAAFRDSATGTVYLSRFLDGRLACVHVLEGLPEQLAVAHDAAGRITAVKDSVEAGFVRGGRFYTREEAAKALARRARASGAN